MALPQEKALQFQEPTSAAIEGKFRQALALHQQGQLAEAEKLYHDVVQLLPTHFDARHMLGVIALQTQRLELGVDVISKAIALNPNVAAAYSNLANGLNELKRHKEAIANYDKAIALKPDFSEAYINRGIALREMKRSEEALASFDKAIALKPEFAEVRNNRGNALNAMKRHEDALASFDKAIALKPDYAEAHNNRGNTLNALKRHEEALASCDKAIALKSDYAEACNNRGNALNELNRFEDALASYDRALAIQPHFDGALHNRGIVLMELGRLAEARQAVGRAIQLAPRKASFYRTLGEISRYVTGDPRVAAMEELAWETASLSIDDRVELHFALAKAYEDLGRSEDAFEQLLAGNALKRRRIEYDEAAALGMLERIREVFTPDLIRIWQDASDPSRQPIFIVGMPRSGTTLVEQILASHAQVFGAGELEYFGKVVAEHRAPESGSQAFPEAVLSLSNEQLRHLGESYLAKIKPLAPQAARMVDKMPSNYVYAGLIHLVLPNAAIIHTVRDPIDTCISCFSKLFDKEQNHTYDLAELGRYYRHYQALMAHWHRILPPGRILDVRYEDVVADLEGQARRLVAHCGLDWDDRCLSFYKSNRPVRTASAAQVRQPIYHSAVGRWRAYEKLLDPLLMELGAVTLSPKT